MQNNGQKKLQITSLHTLQIAMTKVRNTNIKKESGTDYRLLGTSFRKVGEVGMKANKLITTAQEFGIKITGITLLSKEEYEENRDIIPAVNWWWLRSPGSIQDDAAYVCCYGSLYNYNVNYGSGCVRPALYVWNPQSSDLNRGDKFELAGYSWTMLSNDLALCNETVGQTCFRRDWRAEDANVYDKSDIKQWLHDWAEKTGIEFMMQTFSPD